MSDISDKWEVCHYINWWDDGEIWHWTYQISKTVNVVYKARNRIKNQNCLFSLILFKFCKEETIWTERKFQVRSTCKFCIGFWPDDWYSKNCHQQKKILKSYRSLIKHSFRVNFVWIIIRLTFEYFICFNLTVQWSCMGVTRIFDFHSDLPMKLKSNYRP